MVRLDFTPSALCGKTFFAPAKITSLTLAAVFALGLTIPSAGANERVQLSAFVVKAVNEKRKRVLKVPVTLLVEVTTKKRANYVCALSPRIRDAILRDIPRYKFSIDKKGRFNAPGVAARAKATIAKAIRWNVIERVHVLEGAPKVASASAVLFSRNGCILMAPGRLNNRQQNANSGRSRSDVASRNGTVRR